MSSLRDDELEAGRVGRRERLRALYADQRLDLLRFADLLGADEAAADEAVESAFMALAGRPWVRDAPAFLRREVDRRCPSSPAQRDLVLRFRAGDRSVAPASARSLAARARAVRAGPARLEGSLGRRAARRRRAVAGAAVLAVVVAASVLAVRTADRPHPTPTSAPAAPVAPVAPVAPLAPDVTVPAPAVGTVPLGRYGLAVLADPGVEVLDATGGRTAVLANPSSGATALGTSPDGRYVAARVGGGTVQVLDQRDQLVWSGAADLAVWSPTADTLALDGPAGVTFLTVTRAGIRGANASAGTPLAGAAGLAWRPDGSAVAVGTSHGLWLVAAAGTTLSSVTAPAETTLDPVAWTGDGARLLAFDEPEGTALNTYGVRVLSAGVVGGHLVLGRQLGASVPQPGWWSADGRTAVLGVLGSGYGAVGQQRVVRCDLRAQTCATLAAGAVIDPVATASGIAYLAARGGLSGDTVVLAGADGSHARAAPGAPVAEQVLADGDVLLLAGTTGIYRYTAGTADLLTAIDTDGTPGQGTEIVTWQPNARSTPPSRT